MQGGAMFLLGASRTAGVLLLDAREIPDLSLLYNSWNYATGVTSRLTEFSSGLHMYTQEDAAQIYEIQVPVLIYFVHQLWIYMPSS